MANNSNTIGQQVRKQPNLNPKAMFLERPSMQAAQDEQGSGSGPWSDDELLTLFKDCKKESFENRWIWERGWMRNVHYINNRQWIEYVRRTNEWRDVRLARWLPKPVTNVLATGVQAIRAMFAAVNIGADVKPIGNDPKNVAVASLCDDMIPLLHEEHCMDDVMNEHDFWFIVTGNVFLHTFLERDMKYGSTSLNYNHCTGDCGQEFDETQADESQPCPNCGGVLSPTMEPDPVSGEPRQKQRTLPNGRGVTTVLSPFELAFPNTYPRFSDVPYVIRLRWRTKSYYVNHPTLKNQVQNVKWAKHPADQALMIFRSLPYQSDMGVAPFLSSAPGSTGGGNSDNEEGATEYELWYRPCDQYPEGLVMRVLGDSNPIILHLEDDENVPGPLPYKDAKGEPLFTFSHSAFEQRGGRVYGVSPLDLVIQKQNQLNQLDSFVLMIINRMSNPLWLVPKGAEIQKFTGQPGLVVKWNPLTVGGNAKPERVDGLGPNETLFQLRDQYMNDIEQSLGTYDVLKGQKTPGVDSFAGLQLMTERAQSRFGSAFKSRGKTYSQWAKWALEIEREFGPLERTVNVLSPGRIWTVKKFLNADLNGTFDITVDDGTMTPKTALGIRASVEHLNSLGFINPTDPDQSYKVFQIFGQTQLNPGLDIQMQGALRAQDQFEQWAADPAQQQATFQQHQQAIMQYQQQIAAIQHPTGGVGQPVGAEMPQIPPPPSPTAFTPLAWKPWYNAIIRKQEFLKWVNSDKMQQLLAQNPGLEGLLTQYLQDIQSALPQWLPPPPPAPPGGAAQGAGVAMRNSNQNAGGVPNIPSPGAVAA